MDEQKMPETREELEALIDERIREYMAAFASAFKTGLQSRDAAASPAPTLR